LEESGSQDPWVSWGSGGLEEQETRFVFLVDEEVIELDSELVGIDLGLVLGVFLAELELEIQDVGLLSDEGALGGINGGSQVGDSVDD